MLKKSASATGRGARHARKARSEVRRSEFEVSKTSDPRPSRPSHSAILREWSHIVPHLQTLEALACQNSFCSLLIASNPILLTMVWWARDSPACSNGNTDFTRGFVRLIRCLGLDESKQALVFLRGSKELEGDAASAHRTDHRGHFKRKFTFAKRQLQIEDVVCMDLGLAFDDTAAHREIKHRS